MASIVDQFRSSFKISSVSSLQLFQLTRYAGFTLIGIAFAKMGISKSEIGQYETFMLITGTCSFFWIAGLMNSMLAIYATQQEEEKKRLLFTTFSLLIAMSLTAGLVQLFIPGGSRLVLGYLLFNNAAYMVEYILFLTGQRRKLIVYGIVIAVIQLGLCVWSEYNFDNMDWTLSMLVTTALIKFAYVLWQVRINTIIHFDFRKIKYLFLLALPLMMSFFVTGSAEYIDGYIVKHYFSIADFSVFRYGSHDFPFFTILAATLSMSLIPKVAENLSTGLESIKKESLRYMHFFFPTAIAVILLSKWLFTIFFSPQFTQSGQVFAVLMLLTIPRMVFPQTILTALKANRLILLVAVAEMLVNLSASLLLAPHFGLEGVAMGTVIAFTAEKIMMSSILYVKYKISPLQFIPLRAYLAYSIATIAVYVASLYL